MRKRQTMNPSFTPELAAFVAAGLLCLPEDAEARQRMMRLSGPADDAALDG